MLLEKVSVHWQIFVLTVVEISELYGNFLTVCHTLKGIMSIKWVTLEVPVYVLYIVYTQVILPVRQSYTIYSIQYTNRGFAFPRI